MLRSLAPLLVGALSFSQVNSHPALPISQPKVTPNTINTILAQEYFPSGNEFIIQDDKITKGISLSIKYPQIDVFLEKKSFDDRARDVLTQTLPNTLKQFGLPADQIQAKVDEGIPLIISAIKDLINEEELTSRSLERRDSLDDLAEWGKEYGCGLVATAGVGLFLIAAMDFELGNSGGITSTPEQDFFVFPVHGNLVHDESAKIFYRAHQNFAFQGVAGTTFGRNIYFPDAPVTSFSTAEANAFEIMTRNLIHELAHVKQYKARGYNLHSFGLDYIYQWCHNGGYLNVDLEVEAYGIQKAMDKLLVFSSATRKGNEFFQVWRTQGLGPILGLPTAQMFNTLPVVPGKLLIRELPFQKGVLQINDAACFRTFTLDEIDLRNRANCNPNGVCIQKREPLCPVNKDCSGPEPKDPEPNPTTSSCTPAQKADNDARNAACRKTQSDWTSLDNSRTFTCHLGLPDPTPKSGCPSTCHMLNLKSANSPACKSDGPPPDCDFEVVEDHNKKCAAERAHCS